MTQHKQMRGGSWLGIPWLCRSASRAHGEPGVAVDFLGFRVVCNEDSPPSHKTLCGGSWVSIPRNCRSDFCDHTEPDITDFSLGFAFYRYGFRIVCNEEPRPLALQLRGGSWYNIPWDCRSAYRNRRGPSVATLSYGFRVVCNEKP